MKSLRYTIMILLIFSSLSFGKDWTDYGTVAPADGDLFITQDISNSNIAKYQTPLSLWDNYFKTKADLLYEPADTDIVKSDVLEIIAVVWTFSAFPITPSAAPTTDYQVANKKYVDDSVPDEAAMEAIIDLQDLQGAVTDAQVPDTITIDLATLASTVTIADNEATAENNAVMFVPAGDLDGGNYAPEADGDFTYNPSTGTVAATIFTGDLTATQVILTGADADPSTTAGMIKYDNTMTNVLTNGSLKWWDGSSVRRLVDIDVDPSDDNHVIAYDAVGDKWELNAPAGGSGLPTTGGTMTGNITLDDNDTDSPSIVFTDATEESATLLKTDGAYTTLTTVAADGLQIVTGNFKVGGGTPGQTLDGEDGYVTGLLEVDGVIHADGGMTIAQNIADNDILTVDDASAADGELAVFTANGIEGVDSIDVKFTGATGEVMLGDTDAAGAAADDEDAGSIKVNMSATTEDAEVSDFWLTYFDAGTEQTFSFWDASDWSWTMGVMTDAATPAAVSGYEALKWDFNTPTDNEVELSVGVSSGVTDLSFNGFTLQIDDSATLPPLNLTERSAAPSSPASGDIYLDDGTNTASTLPGWRRYTGAAWEDVGATAGGSGLPTTGGTMTGNITLDDNDTHSPSIIFTDATEESATLLKTDGAYTTLTTVAADGFQVLTGNLKVGNGTPDQTIDGEDVYIEGILEVGGTTYTDRLVLIPADISPASYGQIVYDSTVTELAYGSLRYKNTNNQNKYLLDYITVPSLDGHIMVYDETTEIFVPKVMSGDTTMDETGAVTIAANAVEASMLATWYGYSNIPIWWAVDGTSAPAALDETTRKPYAYRDFDDTADEDVNIVWFVPSDLSGSVIQFRVKYLVTNATGPVSDDTAFALSGVSLGDNDATNGAKGTPVAIVDSDTTAVQWDLLTTAWSGDVTITNLAAGEIAELALIRDVSAESGDPYAQDVGVVAIEIRYTKNPA